MESEVKRRSAAGTVMASLDGDSGQTRLIIADVSRDEAWISMPESDAPHLERWR